MWVKSGENLKACEAGLEITRVSGDEAMKLRHLVSVARILTVAQGDFLFVKAFFDRKILLRGQLLFFREP